MNFCLNPNLASLFKEKVSDGTIDTNTMSGMTSEERRSLLENVVGKENAQQVNAEFEKKLLLKDVQAGLKRWADSLSNVKPDVKRDIFSRIEKMDKVLSTSETDRFLKDLASTKLGVDVTAEESQHILELSRNVSESKKIVDSLTSEKGFGAETQSDRLELGSNKVLMQNYLNELKGGASTLTLPDRLKPNNWFRNVQDIMGATKGFVASLTSHAPLKHGFMALFEDPVDWGKNYAAQFSDAAKTLKGDRVMDTVRAEGYSRENSINGIYDKWIPGELNKPGEEFYSDVPSSIPGIGRVFKASKVMFDSFNLKMRMDLVDHYVNIVQKMGLDPYDAEVAKSWGKLAIDQTGGKSMGGGTVGNFFLFSERLLKSQAQNLTAHIFDKSMSSEAKIQSAKTLSKMVLGVGAVIATANALHPGSAETDPRSSNFGTIRIGNTRYDISGGMKGLVTLATRVGAAVSGKPAIKSSTTGKLSSIGTKFGQESWATLIGNFLQGRAAPLGQVLGDLANQQTFEGKKATIKGEVEAAFTPIPFSTYQILQNDPAANVLGTMIAQQLGIMSTTYGGAGNQYSAKANTEFSRIEKLGYSVSLSKPDNLKLFQDILSKQGEQAYNDAVNKYNSDVASKINSLVDSSGWNVPVGASDPTKAAPKNSKLGKIKTIEEQVQEQIRSEYHIPRAKRSPSDISTVF